MPIRPLSALLVNQIAAGEVIERPASVVRELIDNALDAGATRIDIDIEEGGRERVRVADDGAGIAAEELALALTPHATSKIAAAADLAAIATMGFRGEALASIASVSRMKLISRTADADAGASIDAAGDELGSPRPVGCAVGTVVEVRNLFFNTPARRKFLRGVQTEFSHVHELVQRVAIAHPDRGFKLRHNERVVLDVPRGQTADQRAFAVLGQELREAMLELESDERGIGLWGLAGLPAIARATARHQYIYVNNRPVRDRQVAHAIREAYRGLIEPTRQPTIVLFITLDPTQVDVNVHPAKAEVRFVDSNAVHGQVLAVLRQRLLGADLTPRAGFHKPHDTVEWGASPQPTTDVNAFVDYFKKMDPNQKGFVYQQVKQELGIDGAAQHADADASQAPASSPSPADASLTPGVQPTTRSVLQIHNSYIVTQDEQGIVIIDQHALHERMMFQSLLDRIEQRGHLQSQRLLTPATVPASQADFDTLERLKPLLERLGIEAEPMGPSTIGVHAFASLLFERNVEPDAFMRELLDRAGDEQFNPSEEAALHETLDMMSCKAAVKAGDRLDQTELAELLGRMNDVERVSNCPHGRPTTVRLTLRDLEKHFKRS